MFIRMWRMPPCRNPAVISRHHCPAMIAGPYFAPNRNSVWASGSIPPPPLREVCNSVAIYSPVLMSMIIMVVKRACGISPPSASDAARRETALGATSLLQYGQILSSVVMNARHCGHMRRFSTCFIVAVRRYSHRTRIADTIKSALVRTEEQLRQDIVQVGRMMFEKGWVAANDGNITLRLDGERILATPTGVCKGMMRPEDLIVCNLQGDKLCGERERTS